MPGLPWGHKKTAWSVYFLIFARYGLFSGARRQVNSSSAAPTFAGCYALHARTARSQGPIPVSMKTTSTNPASLPPCGASPSISASRGTPAP